MKSKEVVPKKVVLLKSANPLNSVLLKSAFQVRVLKRKCLLKDPVWEIHEWLAYIIRMYISPYGSTIVVSKINMGFSVSVRINPIANKIINREPMTALADFWILICLQKSFRKFLFGFLLCSSGNLIQKLVLFRSL